MLNISPNLKKTMKKIEITSVLSILYRPSKKPVSVDTQEYLHLAVKKEKRKKNRKETASFVMFYVIRNIVRKILVK